MAKKALPTPEQLRQLLRYEPETGKLFWMHRDVRWFLDGSTTYARRWNTRYAGKTAMGSKVNKYGHLGGPIFNATRHAHRVIWAMVHNEWPKEDIDHIDGDPANNRIANLRSVSRAENTRNRSVSSRSISGVMGVWAARHNSSIWYASIHAKGRSKFLGSYGCITAAMLARKVAEQQFGFHKNHGRE